MTIENIVIGTAGIHIFQLAGALYKLLKTEYIKLNEIKQIYCTSAGAIMGVMLCLKTDWDDLIDYMIKNPWAKTFDNLITTSSIFSALNEKGVLDKQIFIKIFYPIFKIQGLKMSMTLKELYEYSKIKINIYSFNISTFESELFNHETYPDINVLDVLYASCALPFIFKPIYINNNMYMDGGLKEEYPLNKCIEDGHEKDTILGLRITDSTKYTISENDNILKLAYYLLRRFIINNRTYYKDTFENEIQILCTPGINLFKTTTILSDENIRYKWIKEGKDATEKYLLTKLNNNT